MANQTRESVVGECPVDNGNHRGIQALKLAACFVIVAYGNRMADAWWPVHSGGESNEY